MTLAPINYRLCARSAIGLLLLTGTCAFAEVTGRERPVSPSMVPPSITDLDEALPVEVGSTLPRYEGPRYETSTTAFDSLSGAVPVTTVAITGNTILGDELAAVAAAYQGRSLSMADLRKLQDELSLVYVQRGYLTSGVTITGLEGDVLHAEAVEGRLEAIRASSDGRYRPEYVASYIESFGELQPVNAFDIERRLQALQNEPQVLGVDARLLPGEQRGDAILQVATREAPPLSARLEANNYQTPAVGSFSGQAVAGYHNLAGRGDAVDISVRSSEGLRELVGQYSVPFTARGTRVEIYGSTLHSEIVNPPFDDLDIEADSATLGARFVHPISREPASPASVWLTTEFWRSKTYLLGSGFSFVEGPDEGVGEAAVLRFGGDWRKRGASSVFAVSTELSFGLHAFGATEAKGDAPDGEFVSATLRSQWARRLDFLDSQLITRFDAQLAKQALLGMEQMTLGGRWTMRGYHENSLIRDNGVIASFEWRVPFFSDASGRPVLEIGPFVDLSYSWNTNRNEVGPKKLRSFGLGLRLRPIERVDFEMFWGHTLDDIDYPGDDTLQDAGIHMGLVVHTP